MRKTYLDYLRAIATVFVIGVHTVSLAATMVPGGSTPFVVLEIFDFAFLSCNLLFVMISGALLLAPRGEGAIGFYKRRLLRVAVPLVVYYVLYVCAKEGLGWLSPRKWPALAVRILSGAPEEAPHFWLVYVLLGLYILTPFFRWIIGHIPFSVFCGVIAVVFAANAISTYLPSLGRATRLSAITDSFAGTYLFGYFLSIFEERMEGRGRRLYALIMLGGAASFLASCALVMFTDDYGQYIYQNAPTMMLYSGAIFLAAKHLAGDGKKPGPAVSLISKYSYQILLIHWGVLHFVVKQKLGVSVLSGGIWGGCILMMALTLALSLLGGAFLENTLFRLIYMPFRGRRRGDP